MKKKEEPSVDASVLLRRGTKYSQEEIRRQSVEQRHSSHIQTPNPDTIVDVGKCLLMEA